MDELDLSQFKEVFVSESREHLVSLNAAIVELEKQPSNKDVLNSIFRVAHTLKGMSATMGYEKITSLAHKMEDVLDKLRKGEVEAKRDIVDVIFACLDSLEALVEEIATDAPESKVNVDPLIAQLNGLLTPGTKEASASQPPAPAPAEMTKPVEAPKAAEAPKQAEVAKPVEAPAPTEQPAPVQPAPVPPAPVQPAAPPPPPAAPVEEEREEKETGSETKQAEETKEQGADPQKKAEVTDVPTVESIKKSKASSIRINISHLDTMMNLVGEMVISKSQLEQIAVIHQIEQLKQTLQQLDRIAVDLQEAVLKTRMVPLSQIFDRYPRMVRDLSVKLGKEIEFEINGADIEIDRMLLEEINEPLVHLLRNALDHGIESTDKRLAAGKPQKGRITLNARRERGYISIEVADDGKGLDPQVLRQTAVKRNMITAEDAKAISDEDAYLLICDPRFTTAEKITDISGRGVGMDVVKTAINSFNGQLTIRSVAGQSSSFTVNLPLSIAIISALLVKVGRETYAIPLNNITEVVPLNRAEVRSIERKEVIVLRDEVLPLVWLERVLGSPAAEETVNADQKFVLRIEVGNKSAGLVIDSFLGRKEIVIKTLGGLVKRSKGFSGATILGDGSVVLILDVASWI